MAAQMRQGDGVTWLAVVHWMVDGGRTRRRITLARPPTSSANRRSSSLSASNASAARGHRSPRMSNTPASNAAQAAVSVSTGFGIGVVSSAGFCVRLNGRSPLGIDYPIVTVR